MCLANTALLVCSHSCSLVPQYVALWVYFYILGCSRSQGLSQGHPLLMSEICTLGAASSAVGEPQNHNFHVSRSFNQYCAKPTPVYFNSP